MIEGLDKYDQVIENDQLTCFEKRNLSIVVPIDEEIEPGVYSLLMTFYVDDTNSSTVWFFFVEGCGLEQTQLSRYRFQFNQGNDSEFSTEDTGTLFSFI